MVWFDLVWGFFNRYHNISGSFRDIEILFFVCGLKVNRSHAFHSFSSRQASSQNHRIVEVERKPPKLIISNPYSKGQLKPVPQGLIESSYEYLQCKIFCSHCGLLCSVFNYPHGNLFFKLQLVRNSHASICVLCLFHVLCDWVCPLLHGAADLYVPQPSFCCHCTYRSLSW